MLQGAANPQLLSFMMGGLQQQAAFLPQPTLPQLNPFLPQLNPTPAYSFGIPATYALNPAMAAAAAAAAGSMRF